MKGIVGLLAAAKTVELTSFDDEANRDAREFLRLHMGAKARDEFDAAMVQLRAALGAMSPEERAAARRIVCTPAKGVGLSVRLIDSVEQLADWPVAAGA